MDSFREQPYQIAVVGDIHDHWEASEDRLALQQLGVDLVLFVGDFGNESVEVVRAIASLDLPKAVVMGNHDAWYNASDWGRKKSPYDHTQEDRVQQQLELLGETHVGYGKLDFPGLNLSVVGSRPFSWGGAEWQNRDFYRDRFGVNNFEESSDRIVAAANEAAYDTVLLLGHNGPTGLGDQPEDTCGRDWNPRGGDFGDPDLTKAIKQVRASGKTIPLVTFGHMHHRLRHTQSRLRTAISTDTEGTIYFNSASVPRIMEEDGDRLRNFSLVSLTSKGVSEISLVWLGQDFTVASKQTLYRDSQLTAQPTCG